MSEMVEQSMLKFWSQQSRSQQSKINSNIQTKKGHNSLKREAKPLLQAATTPRKSFTFIGNFSDDCTEYVGWL